MKNEKRNIIRIFLYSLIALCSCTAAGLKKNASVYTEKSLRADPGPDTQLSRVSFSRLKSTPTDDEVITMTDEAINSILGPGGLASLIKKGDKVVIKVNLVGPSYGLEHEKGLGIISDPRIVRHVAEKVRDIIGFSGGADLKIIDALFYRDRNPSDRSQATSFHYAKLSRPGGNVYYDENADGILDGKSKARLINLDSLNEDERFLSVVNEPFTGETEVMLPKFLRRKEQARGEEDYCDIYIGIPVLKSHAFTGITGAIKLSYGLSPGIIKRAGHHGYGWGTGDIRRLLDYLCALSRARPFDLIVMDALTGNRRGPLNTSLNLGGYSMRTDYIRVNSILCSKDSAAIDTVETLLAGYALSSVPLLDSAYRDGIGMTKPSHIEISGYDGFYLHKAYLRETNGSKYPFEDGWGNARIHHDYSPPQNTTISAAKQNRFTYEFKYSAAENSEGDSGIARIDLVINGKTAARAFSGSGSFVIDMNKFRSRKIKCRIAAWDNVLNCSLSNELILDVR